MSNRTTAKVTYESQEILTTLDTTGEVTSQIATNTKNIRLEAEPPYVKLYLDCLAQFKGTSVKLSPVLLEFLRNASYANTDDCNGGQIVYINKALKVDIANKCGLSLKRIEQGLTMFVEKDIMRRVSVGKYQFNANFFGKGEWKDIRNIRANFNFGTGKIIAEIVKNEEESMTQNQEELQKEFDKKFENK